MHIGTILGHPLLSPAGYYDWCSGNPIGPFRVFKIWGEKNGESVYFGGAKGNYSFVSNGGPPSSIARGNVSRFSIDAKNLKRKSPAKNTYKTTI